MLRYYISNGTDRPDQIMQIQIRCCRMESASAVFVSNPIRYPILTLKRQAKFVADDFHFFFFLFFRENKSWHFMWIICWADNSHEMSTCFPWKKEKKSFRLLQLWSALSGLRIKRVNTVVSVILRLNIVFFTFSLCSTYLHRLPGSQYFCSYP